MATKKVSLDITEDTYNKIMDLAYKLKIYKLGGTINFILAEYFKALEENDK